MLTPHQSNWLAGVRSNPQAIMRLFCFPYSGASASLFFSWRDILPAVEVCPVELPGHGARLTEPLVMQLAELTPLAAQGLWPHLDKPYALFGHSMGALLSFELARYLRRAHGRHPAHLFVSGHPAPHLPRTVPPIHDLPDAEFVEQMRRLNGTPPGVLENTELREILLPILRAGFSICETYSYTPEEPLSCPITSFGGLQDPDVTREGLAAWQQHTTGRFSVRMLPGDHFFLTNATAKPLLLRVLAQELHEVCRTISTR